MPEAVPPIVPHVEPPKEVVPPPVVVPAAEAPKPDEVPKLPEKYDLKNSKDSLLDASHVEKIASFAKERGFSQEHAQVLLDRENEAVSGFAKKQVDDLKKKAEVWVSEVKNDAELGGDGFNKNIEMAKRVVSRFGSDSLKKTLDDTGLGSHPELVRFVARIGKAMSEDQLVIPSHSGGAGKKNLADVLYDKTN